MTTTVVMIRHGQTEWNAERRIQGQTESVLSELGRRQAERAAEALAARPVDVLYSSDLGRARETAAPWSARLGLEVRTDVRLRELHYGVLEGRTWPELEASEPALVADLRAGRLKTPPGGESRSALRARAVEVMEELVTEHRGRILGVVTHGGFAASFLGHVMGLGADVRPPVRPANCAIHEFTFAPEAGWALVTWGEAAHLHGL